MNEMSFKDRFLVVIRSFFLQASFNYERFQNIGFLFIILQFLKRIYKDDPAQLRNSLLRHLDIFNTNPYMSCFVVGNIIKMEMLKEDEKKIINIKQALACAFASIGDRIFWARLRVLTSTLTFLLFLIFYFFSLINSEAIAVCVISSLIFYSFSSIYIRWIGTEYGWKCGGDRNCGIDTFNWNRWIRILSRIGFFLITISILLIFFIYGYLYISNNNKDIVFYVSIPIISFLLQRYFRRNKKSIFYPVISFIIISFILASIW
jgi:mannose/fructose/N-acetylgalactosamine-specific phosphotransferase system component IID